MPPRTLQRPALRWAVVAAVLALAWLVTPHQVPLYDGIGFPDEPYRFVPAKDGRLPATIATVELKMSGGSNSGGLIANSAEAGPQVSVYAPPHAFRAPGTTPITLTAQPIPPQPPLPPGRLDSNVYALSLTSDDGPVTLDPAAQPPAMTMRSVTVVPSDPVFEYRASPTARWQELRTRKVGRDVFNTNAPGAGEYVLVQSDAATPKTASTSKTALYLILGATALLMALVIIGVRVMSKRAATAA